MTATEIFIPFGRIGRGNASKRFRVNETATSTRPNAIGVAQRLRC